MEQEPPITDSSLIPPTRMQPKLGRNTAVLIGLGIVMFLVAVSGGWWLLQNRSSSNTQNAQSQNTVQAQQQTQPHGLIKYNSIAPVIKTISQPKYQMPPGPDVAVNDQQDNHPLTIRLLNIGTITDGQFKDKTLALALYEYANTLTPTNEITYAYFISDATGNPIAWDSNFFHYSDAYCYTYCGTARYGTLIGLTDKLQQNLGFLPKEFSLPGNTITVNDHKTLLSVSRFDTDLVPLDSIDSSHPVGLTEAGMQIVKTTYTDNTSRATLSPSVSYFVVLPFGKMIQVALEPDFMDANDVPQLTWADKTKPVASYGAVGGLTCYNGSSTDILYFDQFQSSFIQTGTTDKGDAVYEIDAQKYPTVYECLYDGVIGTHQDPATYRNTIAYADFTRSHPILLWRHPFGDLIAFVRTDNSSIFGGKGG